MFGDIGAWLIELIYWLPGILIGFVMHEFAHALAADRLGDPTPRMTGRLTLNPIAHIDPLGFLMLIIAKFGWAKPVMTNPARYKIKRFGFAIVGLAGPTMNLLLAVVFLFGYMYLATRGVLAEEHFLMNILGYAIQINIILMVFNLIPIPPLDGYNILKDAVLIRFARPQTLWNFERYGQFILLALVFLGATSRVISTVTIFLLDKGVDLFYLIFGMGL
jgi:Zn-dependent protease